MKGALWKVCCQLCSAGRAQQRRRFSPAQAFTPEDKNKTGVNLISFRSFPNSNPRPINGKLSIGDDQLLTQARTPGLDKKRRRR